jgi:DNA polymerase
MWLRRDLDDKLKRYLRQQLELGGAEVILPVPPETPEPPSHPVAEPGKWRKGAPPIPGPGMTVQPPTSGPIVRELDPLTSLDLVAAHIAECRRCQLCETRTNTVPGEGNPQATLMLVGEGPGNTEDQTGRPFVGKAGQLLDQMLAAIDCPRSSVFIANIVKCRPPGNRRPLPDESAACLPYLHRQIALVRPAVLLALGGTAAEALLGVKRTLGAMRLQVHRYGTTPLIVTYHPAALLRNPHWKKPAWDDVRIARQLLDQHD